MKVFLDSIGCRLNQSEIETYACQFRAAGHTLVPSPAEADLVVVNTCTVTAAAASDSRQRIRQAARKGALEIIVTGCWSTLDAHSAASLPGVSRVVPNQAKDRLVPDLLQVAPEVFDRELLPRYPVPGSRSRTRAFTKVQDGCDNHCTYCITTVARGAGRSRTLQAVQLDIIRALAGGTREVVLTGVHLGSWGKDLAPSQHLADLVRFVLKETDIPRLRLSSLEPWDLDPHFFELWEDTRICRHLHLPLQSGCAATLRRMARKITPQAYYRLLLAARAAVPELAITTDIIAGFPGETPAEYAASRDFIQECSFSGGHVFTYSARDGTAAASLPDQVPHNIRKQRNAELGAVLERSSRVYREKFLGTTLPVLWENATMIQPGSWQLRGLTDNYLRVNACAPQQLWNQITPVHLIRLESGELHGQVQSGEGCCPE